MGMLELGTERLKPGAVAAKSSPAPGTGAPSLDAAEHGHAQCQRRPEHLSCRAGSAHVPDCQKKKKAPARVGFMFAWGTRLWADRAGLFFL